MTPNSDQFTPSMSNQLRAVTLTHVRYRRGDQLGHFLAWISLVPVFISLGGFISHFMFRRELQESKCGSWVLSFGHWQCLRCILGYIWGTIPSVRCLPVLLLGFFLVGCGFGWFIVRLDGVFRRLKKVRLGGCFISKILHTFPIFWSLSMKMQEVQEGIHRTNVQTDDCSSQIMY
ncbi:unnamed protein product [Lactuca saligna]|uniref:Transmembrane protein n=1 Tax=Lactuca saligna TaxID=75948 RepID=A0AA35V3W8_LACSI|nr:unnamed protein product [Lactuca saligna]